MKISNPEREGNPTEQTTQRAEFTYNIPYGRYRIYAVANMGDLAANTRYAEKSLWRRISDESPRHGRPTPN